MDNAGENKLLKTRCESKDWKFNIKFEYTARDTPQQNSKAERGLATIANRVRAMMAAANMPEEVRYRVWSKVTEMACVLDCLVPIKINGIVISRL
jgi:hypothetical protein